MPLHKMREVLRTLSLHVLLGKLSELVGNLRGVCEDRGLHAQLT